ncbi:EAL domain-containing protein [Nitrospirillum iridis]|uniref:PAS domain S-box-containing protein n=1 Tax=Nitrospirillum iridis TaxID=765888 RepID=A0A7X0EGH4_9PROT|nr:sensor domain-containing phosphodiesterase [Nitrospirillum iridis]MBB6254116.1 PAS domain S-box-containing protein [Nitrospirillum iridis]
MKRVERYLGFAFANADLLVEVDGDGTVRFAAGATLALTGWSDAELTGRALADLLAPADRALVRRLLAALGDSDRSAPRPVRLSRRDGREVVCVLAAYHLQGTPLVNVTFCQWAVGQARLPAPADVDPATGLLTRAAFTRAADEGLAPDQPGPPTCSAMTLLEMNNLADIRTRLTAEADGQLMTEIGAVFRHHGGAGAVAGRLADARFGVMAPASLAERITQDIARIAADLGLERPIEVDARTLDGDSFGLSRADRSRLLLHALRRFAEAGAAAVDVLSGQSAAAGFVKDAVGCLARLRDDLGGNRLSLVYEPIIDLKTGRMHHLEVLSRFNGDRPGAVITLAEELGVINDVDMLVCSLAMRELETAPADIILAVNLSAVSVGSDLFMQSLMTQLRAQAGLAGRLMFEVTETGQLGDLDRARAVLGAVRRLGHPICLDDFGVGMASFTYIRALDFDHVKLDGSFISRMCASKREEAIVAGMLALCRGLNISAIAEHVENPEQLLRLRGMGCAMGQGWLFSQAMDRPRRRDADLRPLSRPSAWRPTVQGTGG